MSELEQVETTKDGYRPPPIRLALLRFHAAIDGIRELLEVVSPHLPNASGFSEALGELNDRQRAAVSLGFINAKAKREHTAKGTEETETSDTPPEREPGNSDLPTSGPQPSEGSDGEKDLPVSTDDLPSPRPAEKDGKTLNLPDELREAVKRARHGELTTEEYEEIIETEFADRPDLFFRFARDLEALMIEPDKVLLLNASMLTTAVATFEHLLAAVLSIQIERFPGLLDDESRRFSLRDLQEFDSLDDARSSTIADRVEGIMRESFEDWERWFERTASVELAGLCLDRRTLYEVIQRRHLIVHTAGRVTRQYLQRLGVDEPPVGTVLHVTSEYLERALDELDVAGLGLAMTMLCAWHSEHRQDAVQQLNIIVHELLRRDRLDVCIKLAEVGAELGAGDGWFDRALRVNRWIAQKRQDGLESVRFEIEAWDVSALAPEFGLARTILLGDHEKALGALPQLVEDGVVKPAMLADWALFQELRQDPRFKDLQREVAQRAGGEVASSEKGSEVAS